MKSVGPNQVRDKAEDDGSAYSHFHHPIVPTCPPALRQPVVAKPLLHGVAGEQTIVKMLTNHVQPVLFFPGHEDAQGAGRWLLIGLVARFSHLRQLLTGQALACRTAIYDHSGRSRPPSRVSHTVARTTRLAQHPAHGLSQLLQRFFQRVLQPGCYAVAAMRDSATPGSE